MCFGMQTKKLLFTRRDFVEMNRESIFHPENPVEMIRDIVFMDLVDEMISLKIIIEKIIYGEENEKEMMILQRKLRLLNARYTLEHLEPSRRLEQIEKHVQHSIHFWNFSPITGWKDQLQCSIVIINAFIEDMNHDETSNSETRSSSSTSSIVIIHS